MKINTLGIYYDADSFVHKMNPIIKLIFTFIYIISLSMISDLRLYFIYLFILIFLYILSKVPLNYAYKSIRGIVWMLVITFIMDIFFTDGEKLFSYHFLSISKEGIILGTRVCLKFMMFFIMSALMTYTTTIDELASTLYALIRPLERFKFPANEAVLIITIALRFIPVIMEEYEKAYLALKSRGAFEIKNPLHLVCMLGKLIKVMFLSAINRARDITVAMEIRCYR